MKTYWIAFAVCLGGFLQSYVTCAIAGALLFISQEFHLSAFQQGNVASFILIGAIFGVLSSGYLADRWGRRTPLFLAILIYLLTSLASLLVFSFSSFMILRFVTGLAVGITSMLLPMYLAEIAPTAQRGAFVSGYQFSLTVGTLIAYWINFWVCQKQLDWRWMFFVAAIPAALQLLSFPFIPESPKWLLSRQKAVREEAYTEPLFSRPFLFLILIGIVLSAFQQFSGINAVVFFTPRIFSDAGFRDPKDAIFATFLVGIVNVISSFLTILLIDRIGRRKLLLFSQLGIIAMLSLIVFAFATESRFIDLIAVGAVILYIFFYAIGLGPIVWVLISEIFPLSVRAKALSLTTLINWSCNYIVVLLFPSSNAILGTAWTFSIFAILSFGALIFFMRFIPETKGKSLEALEKQFVFRNRN